MSDNKPAPSFGSRIVDFGKNLLRLFLDLIQTFRIFLFIIFFATCIVRFWLGFATFFLSVFNLVLRFLTISLAIISGSPHISQKNELLLLQKIRAEIYLKVIQETVAIVRNKIGSGWTLVLIFFKLSVARKFIALIMSLLFIAMPFAYLIPRQNDVYITENNSLNEKERIAGGPGYLIIGVDADHTDDSRAYRNEDAWWFLKFNSQGLKAKIAVGKKYRLYVVGFRIYAPIVLYPNIITATEIDDNGVEVKDGR